MNISATRKKSIYIGDSIQKVLSSVQDDTRSGRINTVCDRYLAIIAHVMPSFTVNEWCAIFDANSGITHDFMAVLNVHHNVWEYPHAALSAKWQIDAESLAIRIEKMSVPQRIALAEATDRYWGSAWLISNKAQALSRIGVRVRQEVNEAA